MRCIVALICGLLATDVLRAQPTPATSAPIAADSSAQTPKPEKQPAGGRGLRARMRLESLAEQLPSQLKLDEAQAQQFAALVAEQRAALEGDESARKLAELGDTLRAAQQAKDYPRVRQITAEMRAIRDRSNWTPAFLDKVGALLREDQRAALDSVRTRLSLQDRRAQTGANRLERTVIRLRNQLGLTPEQEPQFDALVEQYRERFAAADAERATGDDARRKLLEELRTAQAAHDTAKLNDIEKQLAARRDAELLLLDEFFDELDPLLSDDQRAYLEQYRDDAALPGGGLDNVRTVLRAARRLELQDEQRAALKQIERDAIAAQRQLKRRDKEAQAALAVKTRDQIRAVLSEAQAADFERLLTRGARGGRSNPEIPPATDSAPEAPEDAPEMPEDGPETP